MLSKRLPKDLFARNAAKFRLKDPAAVAHRLHFGKQKRLVGLGNLSLRASSRKGSDFLISSQHPFSNAGTADNNNNPLASASRSINLKHAKKDLKLFGNDRAEHCFRNSSSPSSTRVLKRPWEVALRIEDSSDASPRK